jgi:Flp pilus assembly protein TadG
MRLKLGRSRSKRPRQRGAAAVELALSLVFLIPLLLGIADYGYYFFIAVNVVEAQQAGAVAASRVAIGDCSGGGNPALVNSATTAASNAIAQYIANAGLAGIVTLGNTAPTCLVPSSTSPPPLAWQFNIWADFRPIIGRVAPWMKASPTAGYARFSPRRLVGNGN